MKKITTLMFAVFVSSCVSTKVRDFTDPDYINFTSHKLLIDAPSHLFEQSFSGALYNINVSYMVSQKIFMPTRKYTTEEKAEIIKKNGFDSLLVIEISGGSQSRNVVGYNTNSYASAYSTGYGSAYGSGTSTTIPVVSHNRKTKAQAKLYDVKTGRIVWVGDLNTSASGSLYMSDSSSVSSMTQEIVSSLIKKGHLRKKEKSKNK